MPGLAMSPVLWSLVLSDSKRTDSRIFSLGATSGTNFLGFVPSKADLRERHACKYFIWEMIPGNTPEEVRTVN